MWKQISLFFAMLFSFLSPSPKVSNNISVTPTPYFYNQNLPNTPTPTHLAINPTLTPKGIPTKTTSPKLTPLPTYKTIATPTPLYFPLSTVKPTASPNTKTTQPNVSKLLFSLGPEADVAVKSRLNNDVSLGMYTSWYNSPNDLAWLQFWKDSLIKDAYAKGKSLHLVIFSDIPENGTPCGRPYPISDSINEDMRRLAQIFAGTTSSPPLYVTLFTEFQTYPCIDNQLKGSEAYYTKLKQKIREIRDIFKANAPNSKISIGWGGWQSRWDDPANGGGRSLITQFDDINRIMDFQSVQLMQNDSNIDDAKRMISLLGKYGPVMVAHHKPDGFYPATFSSDLQSLMSPTILQELISNNLFAWSFMDEREMSSSETIYNQVKNIVAQYGKMP